MLKKYSLLLFFINTILYSYSQITVQNTQTPLQLVQSVLLGNGVTATNIKYNGSLVNANTVQQNVTYFDANGTNFPITRGVLLTTGAGSVAAGPNNSGSETQGNTPSVSTDPDLNAIANASVTNGVVLEFDFTATGDTVRFSYMFGSEEYPEFSPSSFNDAFGFFLSGPGINGIYSNNSINLALLPTTSTSTNTVTINNVNPTTNPMYYVDNVNGAAYGNGIQYDGTTVELIAVSGLQCGQTYHIKLCISNVGDQSYDSGVFLQANSFSSNAVTIETNGNISGNTYSDSVLAEGCSSATLSFIRPISQIDTMEVFYIQTSGTIDINADLTSFADSIVFNIGVDTVNIILNPVDDGISEPMEWLKIMGYTVNNCGDTIYDSVTIYILDKFQLNWNLPDTITTDCSTIDPLIEITNMQFSVPNYSFAWSNTTSTNPTTFNNTGVNFDSTYLFVDITDGCNTHYQDSVLIINDYQVPEFSIAPNDTLYNSCPTNQLSATAIVTTGIYSPYTYNWSNNISTATATNLTNNNINGAELYYYVTTTNACGMSTIDSVLIINQFTQPIPIFIPNDTIYTPCLLDSALSVLNVSSGTPPYSYAWSNGSINDSTYFVDTLGINGHVYNFNVTITDACNQDTTINGFFIVNKTLNASLSSLAASSCVPDGSASSVISGNVGTLSYQWIGPGLINGDTMLTQNITNIPSGWYYFTVTDDVCSDKDSVQVDQTISPHAVIGANPLISTAPSIVTFSNNSTNASNYEWIFGNGLFTTSNDLSSQTSVYDTSGIYVIYLIAHDGPCSDTASIPITVLDKPLIISIPNYFSPNFDGANDEWFINAINVKEFNIIITNRWGNVVFEEKGLLPKWDGTIKNGKESTDGVYFYKYIATGYNGDILDGHGFLHLVNE
ncbi:MAG: choice-of-anchor L domain-containing protein [Flavobacteriia bacterium]|nr:choice-of-anchor L domain-containing protein [Flavobacteriia bacterium]